MRIAILPKDVVPAPARPCEKLSASALGFSRGLAVPAALPPASLHSHLVLLLLMYSFMFYFVREMETCIPFHSVLLSDLLLTGLRIWLLTDLYLHLFVLLLLLLLTSD
jgi:hypothetical protein